MSTRAMQQAPVAVRTKRTWRWGFGHIGVPMILYAILLVGSIVPSRAITPAPAR